MPQEIVNDPKLRPMLEPLFKWCRDVGLYLDKLGVTADEGLQSDLERDDEVDAAIDDLPGIDQTTLAGQAFRHVPDQPQPLNDAGRLLADRALNRPVLPTPTPANDAQLLLAERAMNRTLVQPDRLDDAARIIVVESMYRPTAQPESKSDAQGLIAAQTFGRR
jgi:hypothetical protein